jgi:pimeloyl-ACP methyl ester carboxylesterase
LPFSEFVSSQQTVYDMELIRALLHSRLLNFIGYSYGTWLGSWYADTYPRRVGRFVLDSNMDWTHTQLTNVYFDPFSGQRRRDTQLFPWMARHSDQIRGLGSTRLRVAAKYRQIRSSLVALVRSGDETIRGEDLDFRVYGDIYGDTRFVTAALDILVSDEYAKNPTGGVTSQQLDAAWARLAPALRAYTSLEDLYDSWGVTPAGKATRTGAVNVSRMDVIRDALVRARHDTTPDAVVDLGAFGDVVRCNDTPWVHGASYYLNLSDQMQDKYPWIGYENGVPFCAFWPYAPQDRQVNLVGSPRLLQIQSELDPATAYEGSLRSHRLTKKVTRFVAIDDEGQHGQYVSGPSSCVERIGDRFVFTGELPGRDLVCGTTPLPADQSVYPVNGPVDGNSEPLPASKAGAAPNRMLQRILDRVATHALI